MDNFRLDVTSSGIDSLIRVMVLFNPPGGKVKGYSVKDNKQLVFYWAASVNAIALPFPMSLEEAAKFAFSWLSYANYGPAPNHDGDNSKGWRVYCENWGFVDGDGYAFAAITPVWAMYGK